MKAYSALFSLIIFGIAFLQLTSNPEPLKGQQLLQNEIEEVPYILQKQLVQRTYEPNYVSKKFSIFAKQDWAAIIDSTWGGGLPTAQKLNIFDKFWLTIDQQFACFQDLVVNWDSLKNVYRYEIENGVSRGRFAAIMNHLALALKESHTNIEDKVVCWQTPLKKGVPLLVVGGWGENGHFGAGLTPLPDSSLLVYKTVPSHPLGLVPGDIVLGYEGIPWKKLYKELLAAQLPIYGWWWGSSESAYLHSWLMSAGMNWHLFDTIDIIKYSTGDTIHLSTAPLIGKTMSLLCTEQMDITGVPKPNYSAGPIVTYGIIEGTAIGYIYAWGWARNAEQEFYNAVEKLMFDHQTTGMIIDFRTNYGGNMFLSDKALSLLFNSIDSTIGFVERSDLNDHFAMRPSPEGPPEAYVICGDPSTYYDMPIAVLTGPGAISSGDQVALRMKFHPMARIFGKSTAAAFNAPVNLDLGNANWYSQYAVADAYLISNPNNYLTHDEFKVDENVWLTPDDVAQGHDTVVESAIKWINTAIQNRIFAYDFAVDHKYAVPGVDIVGITAHVQNRIHHKLSVLARFKIDESVVIDSTYLFDDGIHKDGVADDGIWGGLWQIPLEERTYLIDVQTNDFDSGVFRQHKNVARFTTIGPIKFQNYKITSPDTFPNPGNTIPVKLTLKNLGTSATAIKITAVLSSEDTNVVSIIAGNLNYSDIAPGKTSTSSGLYVIKFAQNSPGGISIPFNVDIFSDNCLFWSDNFSIFLYPTGITDNQTTEIPQKFALNQNYPNPFNPSTTIEFALPQSSFVTLKVYNLMGEEVATLVAEQREAGIHRFNWDARGLASGVYFYRQEARDFVAVKKLILMR